MSRIDQNERFDMVWAHLTCVLLEHKNSLTSAHQMNEWVLTSQVRQAAEEGDPVAQHDLGAAYHHGAAGIHDNTVLSQSSF